MPGSRIFPPPAISLPVKRAEPFKRQLTLILGPASQRAPETNRPCSGQYYEMSSHCLWDSLPYTVCTVTTSLVYLRVMPSVTSSNAPSY